MGKDASARQMVQLARSFGNTLNRLANDHSNAQRLIENFDLVHVIADGGLTGVMVVKQQYEVFIDYARSLEERYREAGFGEYPEGWSSLPYFPSHHRGAGVQRVVLELVGFSTAVIGTEQWLVQLQRYGLWPANIDHCVAFVAANPPERWQYPEVHLVYATGSVGALYASSIGPVLFAPNDGERKRWNLDHFSYKHGGDAKVSLATQQWFLAVRSASDVVP